MLKSSLIALGMSGAFVALAGCGSPEVTTNGNGGPSGSGIPGVGGSGYTVPPTGTDPNHPGGTTGPGGMTPTDQNNCGIKMIDLQKRPADLLLVLDRSTSMLQDASGQGPGGGRGGMMPPTPMGPQKWTEVVAAIDPVVMATQDQVAWGLKMFPMGEACGVPSGATVPVGLNSYAAVLAAIKANPPLSDPQGSTPTRVAVQSAAAFMTGNASMNSKYLVVATDGLPNCGGSRRGGGGDDAAGAVAAVAAAAKAGIPSFIVGIATAGSDAHDTLNEMAIQGGRARADATKYYPVANKDELVTALGQITGQIASCTFPLNPLPPEPDNVRVNVDGAKVDRDTSKAGGWDYGPGNSSVILNGANCEALKSGAAKNVQILYGCPGRVIE
jgi:hypothetical protein